MPATIQDVARAAGVSVGTVSRAMNNYTDVSAKTRERILQAAQRLGYSPNVMARNLSSKHLKNIALILSGAMEEEMFNHFDIMLMRGCFEFASKKGLDISIHTIDAKIQREKSYEQLCYEYNLAGAVLMGLKVTEPYYCESLAKCKQPCVLIDLEPVGEYVSTVTIDHVAAFDAGPQKILLSVPAYFQRSFVRKELHTPGVVGHKAFLPVAACGDDHVHLSGKKHFLRRDDLQQNAFSSVNHASCSLDCSYFSTTSSMLPAKRNMDSGM